AASGSTRVGEPAGSRPLVTAFAYTGLEGGGSADNDLALKRIRAAGATAFHVLVSWNDIAPASAGPRFQEANPAASGYRWAALDDQIRTLVQHRLTPIIAIISAP